MGGYKIEQVAVATEEAGQGTQNVLAPVQGSDLPFPWRPHGPRLYRSRRSPPGWGDTVDDPQVASPW